MKQKVIKIGSSIGIVLPKLLAMEMGFKAGQEVSVHPEKDRVVVEHVQINKEAGHSKLVAWAEEAVERYRPALEALKDK